MEEIVCDDLSVNIVLRSTLFQDTEGLGEMLVQSYGFMPQLPDQKVFFLDLLFEWQCPVELYFGGGESGFGRGCCFLRLPDLLAQVVDLRLVIFNGFLKLGSAYCKDGLNRSSACNYRAGAYDSVLLVGPFEVLLLLDYSYHGHEQPPRTPHAMIPAALSFRIPSPPDFRAVIVHSSQGLPNLALLVLHSQTLLSHKLP